MTKELCKCGKLAVWVYMPGYSFGDSPYSCDDCVPRGCECNHRYVNIDDYEPHFDNPDLPEGDEGVDWKWIDHGKVWVFLDEKGREYPCAEFDRDYDGFEREINPHII